LTGSQGVRGSSPLSSTRTAAGQRPAGGGAEAARAPDPANTANASLVEVEARAYLPDSLVSHS
jgi:hypothetical protein